MQIKSLDTQFSIADAVYPQDLAAVKAAGFNSLICHRQPGEADDHADAAQLAAAAEAAGLGWREIPVTPGEYTDEALASFKQAVAELPAPYLVFCRSGRRAACMWALHHACEVGGSCDDLLGKAQAAGHDLSDLAERMAQVQAR